MCLSSLELYEYIPFEKQTVSVNSEKKYFLKTFTSNWCTSTGKPLGVAVGQKSERRRIWEPLRG